MRRLGTMAPTPRERGKAGRSAEGGVTCLLFSKGMEKVYRALLSGQCQPSTVSMDPINSRAGKIKSKRAQATAMRTKVLVTGFRYMLIWVEVDRRKRKTFVPECWG